MTTNNQQQQAPTGTTKPAKLTTVQSVIKDICNDVMSIAARKVTARKAKCSAKGSPSPALKKVLVAVTDKNGKKLYKGTAVTLDQFDQHIVVAANEKKAEVVRITLRYTQGAQDNEVTFNFDRTDRIATAATLKAMKDFANNKQLRSELKKGFKKAEKSSLMIPRGFGRMGLVVSKAA